MCAAHFARLVRKPILSINDIKTAALYHTHTLMPPKKSEKKQGSGRGHRKSGKKRVTKEPNEPLVAPLIGRNVREIRQPGPTVPSGTDAQVSLDEEEASTHYHQQQEIIVDDTLTIEPATKRRVVLSHSKARQLGDAELNELLGAPVAPDDQVRQELANEPTRRPNTEPIRNWLDVSARVMRAVAEARNKFYNENEVQSHYATADGVREFVATKSAAVVRSASDERSRSGASATATADASKIDEMIAVANNTEAQRKRAAIATKKRGVSAALTDDRASVTIDEFVTRVLGMSPLDVLGRELFDRPYQVVGLSLKVPNPRWHELERDRAALQNRRDCLVCEKETFAKISGAIDMREQSELERRREALRLELQEFAPIETVELLKPATEVRALNERWRNLLGQVLVGVYREYANATESALSAAHGTRVDASDVTTLAGLYMQRVAAPVFDQYLAQLRSATYEDMPLTREVLQDYFHRFLGFVLEALMRENATRTEEQLQELRARSGQTRPRNVAEALERQAQNLRRDLCGNADEPDCSSEQEDENEPLFANRSHEDTLTAQERERRTLISYLRQALHIYATPLYEQWLERWLAVVRAGAGANDITPDIERTLRLAVRNMIEARQYEHEERNIRRQRVLPRYEPQSEAEIAAGYARLINNALALHRMNELIEQDENQTLTAYLETALVGNSISSADPARLTLPTEVLTAPRADRYELLAEVATRRREQIEAAFQTQMRLINLNEEDNDDDELDDLEVALQGARDTALQDLARRVETITRQLEYYAPLPSEQVRAHTPRDQFEGGDDPFTPFNLSYPLDVTRVRREQPELRQYVERLHSFFDADALHRRADELRSVVSVDYAEKLVERELMRIDHVLRNLAQPEIDGPLELKRLLSSSKPVELSAEIKLRDELALLAEAPSGAEVDERIVAALDALDGTPWRVHWYFKPRFGPGSDGGAAPVLLETQELAAGVTRSTLVRPPMPNMPLALSGLYWAEFESTAGAKYRSVFTGSVRVTAVCKRTGELFEPGTEKHGEATWREHARDGTVRDASEEWLVLVTRGEIAHERLLKQRAENAATRDSILLPPSELFLPPWGTEDEQSLLRAFDRLTELDFTVAAIYGRVVERIGGQLAKELAQVTRATGVSDDLRKLALQYARRTPMELFALVADEDLLARDTDGRGTEFAIAIQLHAAQRAAQGAWSDLTVGDGQTRLTGFDSDSLGEPLLLVDERTSAALLRQRFAATLSDKELLQRVRSEMLLESVEVFDDEALPYSAIRPLYFGYDRGVDELPLATLLRTLYKPIVWRNLTWRERRFTRTLHRRFEEFARQYREEERRALYYNAPLSNPAWGSYVAVPLTHNRGNAMRFDPVKSGSRVPATPILDALEQRIDERLSSFTANTVANKAGRREVTHEDRMSANLPARTTAKSAFAGYASISDALVSDNFESNRFLLDIDQWREYQDLLRKRLVQSGLLVIESRVTSDSRAHYTDDGTGFTTQRESMMRKQAPTDGDGRQRVFSNRGTRAVWIGAHSYTTDQPDFYSVAIDPERGAAIAQRGSVPTGKGYDFDGLHELIECTARQYTSLVRSTPGTGATLGMSDEAIERTRTRLERRLRDLELIYNFFAFVAQPVGGKRILMADDILGLLDDRQLLFDKIGLAATTFGATVLL